MLLKLRLKNSAYIKSKLASSPSLPLWRVYENIKCNSDLNPQNVSFIICFYHVSPLFYTKKHVVNSLKVLIKGRYEMTIFENNSVTLLTVVVSNVLETAPALCKKTH